MNKIAELLPLPGTVVIDVRTPQEYSDGHIAKSINIPLGELSKHLEELKQAENIIVCCASGIRSQKASILLKQNQINCLDGGSWLDINKFSRN
ncbi:MAG TPA: rhodanese-like domain-containing protein [Mucilaginibacter sp.]|jgi:rhodanese-related sulfurtransferase|nr:rhodanese-like domain-containing protein [Mucilaginibacter sp.]